jgi:hypothetical protein
VDFDNDGDLDVLNTGTSGSSNGFLSICLNRKGVIDCNSNSLAGDILYAAWSDFDKDSKVELLVSTQSPYSTAINYILEKEDINPGNFGLAKNIDGAISDVSFADYDNDGDFDALVRRSETFQIYKYENGDYVDSGLSFSGWSGAWADLNSDGNYDLVFGGVFGSITTVETQVFLGDGAGAFNKLLSPGLVGKDYSSIAVGDIDNDGDLDLAIVGQARGAQVYSGNIFLNTTNLNHANTRPNPPTNLRQTVGTTGALLEWDSSVDSESGDISLTYNVTVSRADGSIVAPSHSRDDGLRMISESGNAFNNTFFQLECLQEGSYQWSVQAIDQGYLGSAFAEKMSFNVGGIAPTPPADLALEVVSNLQIELNWSDGPNEDEYVIYRRKVPEQQEGFGLPLITLGANNTHFVDTLGLEPSSLYEYKVVANNCAYYDVFSSLISGETFPRPFEEEGWLDMGESNANFLLLGDFNNDKFLDLLVSYTGFLGATSRLFAFDGEKFTDTGIDLPYIGNNSSVFWTDMNSDGYLDLFIVSSELGPNGIKVFMNNGGQSFSEGPVSINLPFNSLGNKGVALGDYDNDGDQDILLRGYMRGSGELKMKIFKNVGNLAFEDSAVEGLEGYIKSSDPWEDFDNDGDLDILVNRKIACGSPIDLGVLENRGSQGFFYRQMFSQGLNDDFSMSNGDAKWIDLNGDGYSDIISSGRFDCTSGKGVTTVYFNNRNRGISTSYNITTAPLDTDIFLQVGDFDSDGDNDIYTYGTPFNIPFFNGTKIYNNSGNGGFESKSPDYFPSAVASGGTAIGDIDHDSDIDFVVIGKNNNGQNVPKFYRNTTREGWGRENRRPISPTNLRSEIVNDGVVFTWDPSLDLETAQPSLTYQFYLINETDTIVSSISHSDGTRKLPTSGNTGYATKYKIVDLPNGIYRWSVQAIDASYNGSPFAEESTFVLSVTEAKKSDEIQFLAFPNPIAANLLNMRLLSPYLGEIKVRVIDISGNLLRSFSFHKAGPIWEDLIKVDDLGPGMFLVEITMGQQIIKKKVVIE